MPQEVTLQDLTLSGVAHRCSRETDRFFHRLSYDPSFCFELFRRALEGRNEQAINLLYRQYQPLVTGWVERHASFRSQGEETQYFVNRAFEKMWRAVTPEKFTRFPDLKALLRYLKMCAHSAIIDHARTAKLLIADEELPPSYGDRPAGRSSAEERVLNRVQHEELWASVSQRLANEKENLVMYGSFVLALKPRELQARYGDVFADVQEIYRTKQNVLDRLRRDDELLRLLSDRP